MGWKSLIENYETRTTDNEGSPKGDMARTILFSLIKRQPSVEPALDGGLGGACVLQELVRETRICIPCREMLLAIYLDPEYRGEFNKIFNITELQLAEEAIDLLKRFGACRRMQLEEEAPIIKKSKLAWKKTNIQSTASISAYSTELLQVRNQTVWLTLQQAVISSKCIVIRCWRQSTMAPLCNIGRRSERDFPTYLQWRVLFTQYLHMFVDASAPSQRSVHYLFSFLACGFLQAGFMNVNRRTCRQRSSSWNY